MSKISATCFWVKLFWRRCLFSCFPILFVNSDSNKDSFLPVMIDALHKASSILIQKNSHNTIPVFYFVNASKYARNADGRAYSCCNVSRPAQVNPSGRSVKSTQ